MISKLIRRSLSVCLMSLALVPLSGCAGKASRWIWNPLANPETKDTFDAMTGRSGYTGFDPRAREVERSLNSHF
jgi:hypothetical protein